MSYKLKFFYWFSILILAGPLLAACQPQIASLSAGAPEIDSPQQAQQDSSQPTPTPEGPSLAGFTPRPLYNPGELVDYTAQDGDTLPGLALRFNTSEAEILAANPFIPASATTMPPGMPMKIPIYYLPLWGSPYKIIPDSQFANGPAQVGFNSVDFVNSQPGWLKNVVVYASGANRSGGELVDLVAKNYSVSPRLLLALLEYHSQALSSPTLAPDLQVYPMNYRAWDYQGLFLQLVWTANALNNSFYSIRGGQLTSIEYKDGRLERFDPWLNAASASLHSYFNQLFYPKEYEKAIRPEGFARTFAALFGDPWAAAAPQIPGSLVQPELFLPFEPGDVWALTGGPHTGWGNGEPLAAVDFAPPSVKGGCVPTAVFATAVAPGVVARSEVGVVVLDLDGDGDERTGWVIFYLHVGTEGRAPVGAKLSLGDRIGKPSCEGGDATGTHVHVARKFNGEWLLAEGISGVLPFNMEGWVVHNGRQAYLGTMTRFSQTVTACTCSNAASFIQTNRR